jgi:2-polyprenyl-3-methyl-5-hydroxy-6-metoxy-1,4-benzoquinol methylase
MVGIDTMPPPAVCRVCDGSLELAWRGERTGYEPSAFSHSCHSVGAHGDLYRCTDCGTVNQPALPRGTELHDLYRAVSDGAYLDEEEGRRRSARRLLNLLGRYVQRGRLLQVGCGHGLLLDEARRRGYEVEGVELSIEAARYAHERLGLPIREMAVEEAVFDGRSYDAILLVDVLEHLDDPVAALRRLRALLAPGGVLLVVTPDPASFVARVAGGRWWCYVPAHCCLIPRKTLRKLIHARGLEVVEDTVAVRTFTLRYWLAGLGERGGWPASMIAYVAARLPRWMLLTASTRDERVLLARNTGHRG